MLLYLGHMHIRILTKKTDAYSIHNSHAGNDKDILGYTGMYLYALHCITKS